MASSIAVPIHFPEPFRERGESVASNGAIFKGKLGAICSATLPIRRLTTRIFWSEVVIPAIFKMIPNSIEFQRLYRPANRVQGVGVVPATRNT
jgi:hypothetical protein